MKQILRVVRVGEKSQKYRISITSNGTQCRVSLADRNRSTRGQGNNGQLGSVHTYKAITRKEIEDLK